MALSQVQKTIINLAFKLATDRLVDEPSKDISWMEKFNFIKNMTDDEDSESIINEITGIYNKALLCKPIETFTINDLHKELLRRLETAGEIDD